MDRMDFSELTELLDSLGGRFGVPAFDCLLAVDGEMVYRHASPGTDPDCLYWLYSATKLVTCAGAMLLMERGQLSPDDPVSRYLPEYAALRVRREDGTVVPARTTLTVRHLMTMTGGLDYDLGRPALRRVLARPEGERTTRAVAAALAEDPLNFEPGTRFRYSFCHDVLGAVMEAVSGERLSEFLRENILLPLGIEGAAFHPTAAQRARLAPQYMGGAEGETPVPMDGENEWRFGPLYDAGGAGLACPAADYITFLAAMSRGGLGVNGRRILSRERVAAMASPQLAGQPLRDFWVRNPAMEPYNYGLGVRVLTDDKNVPWPAGEFGWDGAAGAYALVDPARHIALFYVQHVYGSRLFIYEKMHPLIRDAAGRCLRRSGL